MTYGSFFYPSQIHLEQEDLQSGQGDRGKFALQQLFQIHEVTLRYILETSGT